MLTLRRVIKFHFIGMRKCRLVRRKSNLIIQLDCVRLLIKFDDVYQITVYNVYYVLHLCMYI
jgi:hypothetical protein